MVKVPQILALHKSHSAEGLSPVSFELEQLGLSVHTAYGFLMGLPFGTFGEALIILIQNTYLLFQIYQFKPLPQWRPALGVVLSAIGASLCYYGARQKRLIFFGFLVSNLHLSQALLPSSMPLQPCICAWRSSLRDTLFRDTLSGQGWGMGTAFHACS